MNFYLDYHATTPALAEVTAAMQPYHSENFGNPASQHAWGWKADLAVNKARTQVSQLLKCDLKNVVFTSGATESIHLAVLGWLLAQEKASDCHIFTSAIEHKASLGACDTAQRLGAHTEVLPVNKFGQLEAETLLKALKKNKKNFVTLIHGHNEIGTLNNVAMFAKLAKEQNFVFHVDAAQSAGKIDINLQQTPIDLLSLSGHKMYGPKGIGALFIRDHSLIRPLFCGGGQEFGMRAGTLNVPAIVGFGQACQWALEHREGETARLRGLRDLFFELVSQSEKISINGHRDERLPHNINITIQNCSSDRLQDALESVAFSAGSACRSGSAANEPSHVLMGLGLPIDASTATVRFGLGLQSNEEHIRWLAQCILKITG